MRSSCHTPIAEDVLIDYWTADLAAEAALQVEAHLFDCQECAARLDRLASLGAGIAALARQGRVSGIISHGILNRMQHDGVRVRQYSLQPGETVACAVFPGDDIVVLALHADLASVDAVRLVLTGPGDAAFGPADQAPVFPSATEVLWAAPGAFVRQAPSMRLRLTLSDADEGGRVLAEYALDHSA